MACKIFVKNTPGSPGYYDIFCQEHGLLGVDEYDFINEIYAAHNREVVRNG